MSTLFVVGQVVLGGYFAVAGITHFTNTKGLAGYAAMKGLPAPSASVMLSGLMLLVGGLGIMFQMYTNLAYGLLIAFLVIAAFTFHDFWKAKDAQAKMADSIQFQKNLALAAALLMLMAA